MSTRHADMPALPLVVRIWGEFLEMPGLRLTRRQAQRLWGADEATCARILECLVEARFLCRIGLDQYGRVTEGASSYRTIADVLASMTDEEAAIDVK